MNLDKSAFTEDSYSLGTGITNPISRSGKPRHLVLINLAGVSVVELEIETNFSLTELGPFPTGLFCTRVAKNGTHLRAARVSSKKMSFSWIPKGCTHPLWAQTPETPPTGRGSQIAQPGNANGTRGGAGAVGPGLHLLPERRGGRRARRMLRPPRTCSSPPGALPPPARDAPPASGRGSPRPR
ncbi:uncharacterized protein LOC144368149 [Ictidomys tridecemlineatus]